ncbi:serine/threonine-protein kinase [Frankia sp. Mgl5]|uniref:serine/threonine-protein kinase n=1 Tax=Frankia sp. Mgl5 TaxID=2933793 RepID=UPI00200C2023|nr:serine/threonine-protein kinase [Frankia sp. Mgl5]MCK9929379.1 serine/threonine-protein kinase [Frankia sp. Mgl5]
MPAIDRTRVATALPAYILGDELGAGSYGLILAGRHRDLERDVAVKVLPIEDLGEGTSLTDTFRAEARLLSRLDHPHIVRIYEFVGREDFCLLIMELLGGGTLTRHRLPAEAACAVGLAMADALAHAHVRGVLHRDIKPDNILFTAAGQPKLTDFGIGAMFEGAAGSADHPVGTPRYMAPEQIAGGRIGPAADQYSLGVVLYELLAGRSPFDSGQPVPELLRQHLEEAPPALGEVPAPVADVVMKALAKEPADRHANAAAFGGALAEAATAYGPDWLARAGLILRLQEIPLRDGGPRRPDSGGYVFTAATARLEAPPPRPAPSTPPDADTGAGADLPALDPPRTRQDRTEGGTAPTDVGGDSGAGEAPAATGRAGTERVAAPDGDTHPFAGTPFGDRRYGWGSRRRVVLTVTGLLAALALAVTGVVLVTADGSADPGTTVAEGTSPEDDEGAAEIAIPRQFSGWVVGAHGVLYLSDQASNRVLRRESNGKVSVVAGTGAAGTVGDGGPGKAAWLNGPTGLALDAEGNLYILDGHNGSGRVRRLDTSGRITTVAGGGGTSAFAPRPTGPVAATSISFSSLDDSIALDPANGDIYIADTSLIYRIDAAGVLTRVARVGRPSTAATPLPGQIDPDAGLPRLLDDYLLSFAVRDGRIYAVGLDTSTLRMLERNGTVRTVAGTGQQGFSGDGGPATAASLDLGGTELYSSPIIAIDDAGEVYIADAGNHRVRRVDARGTITTVAGNGDALGAQDDGRPATTQPLFGPNKIALADDGSFYIDNGIVILRVDPRGILTTVQKL